MRDHDHPTAAKRATRRSRARAAVGFGTAGALLLGSATALLGGVTAATAAVTGTAQLLSYSPAIKLVVTSPRPGDIAGAGGDFTALAQNATGNQELSAANGYRPGLNLPRRRSSARENLIRMRRVWP